MLDFSDDLVTLYTAGAGDGKAVEHLLYLKKGEVPYLDLGLDVHCFGYNTNLAQAIRVAYPWMGNLDIVETEEGRIKIAGIELDKDKIGATSI